MSKDAYIHNQFLPKLISGITWLWPQLLSLKLTELNFLFACFYTIAHSNFRKN